MAVIPAWTLATLFPQAAQGDRVLFFSGQGINQPLAASYTYDSALGWLTDSGESANHVWVAPGEVFTYASAQPNHFDLHLRGCVPWYKQLVVLSTGPSGQAQDVPLGLMSPVPIRLGDILGASTDNAALLNNRDFLLVPANQSPGTQKGAAMVLVYWFGWGWYNGAQPMSDYQLVPGWGYLFRKSATPAPEAVIIEIVPPYLP